MGKNGDRGTASKISYTEKEYIFDSKTRKASRGTILTFVTIGGVCVLTAVVLALIWVLNGKRPEDTIHGALVILMIGCITFYTLFRNAGECIGFWENAESMKMESISIRPEKQ